MNERNSAELSMMNGFLNFFLDSDVRNVAVICRCLDWTSSVICDLLFCLIIFLFSPPLSILFPTKTGAFLQRLSEVPHETSLPVNPYAELCSLAKCARLLLVSLSAILQLLDSLVIRQLLISKQKVNSKEKMNINLKSRHSEGADGHEGAVRGLEVAHTHTLNWFNLWLQS